MSFHEQNLAFRQRDEALPTTTPPNHNEFHTALYPYKELHLKTPNHKVLMLHHLREREEDIYSFNETPMHNYT